MSPTSKRKLGAGIATIASAALIAGSATAAWSDDSVTRLDGTDRFETAQKVSEEYYETGVDRVFVASGQYFPDALTAGPVAAAGDGSPILLVKSNNLPAKTKEELERLKPKTIVVLGGTSVISNSLRGELTNYTSGSVSRVSGSDRYSTAATIATENFNPDVDIAYIASGEHYADALAGVPMAGIAESPILLTKSGHLPNATKDALEILKPGKIVVLGGTVAVANSVAGILADFTDGAVERISGENRWDTAAAISKKTFADPTPVTTVFLASGDAYPDALTGGPVAADNKAPVLLVKKDSIPSDIGAELARLCADEVIVLGGTLAIADTVANEAVTISACTTVEPTVEPTVTPSD